MSRRFQWGASYLLTDLKEGILVNEPAIYVGKKDSDMERPTICTLCGQPLGAEGYHSFFLMGPNGHGKDMMFGNGCIRDRISEKLVHKRSQNFKDDWNRLISEFPKCGRWYGTFLHHSIAKPYVKDKNVVNKWNESILNLPGVKYIMNVIDDLRNENWSLNAEIALECGNVDLLATHPEKGTLVFDWKSDISFLNRDAYIEQIHRYMSELSKAGMQKICGYILWIRNGTKEYVPFNGISESTADVISHSHNHPLPIKCTLNIDMNGGESIKKKRISEYSKSTHVGDVVSFYIPPCEPFKEDHEFSHFEASPYKETNKWSQTFNKGDLENGFLVSFICSKKRHSFSMIAYWNRTGPLECCLEIQQRIGDRNIHIYARSEKDKDGAEFVEFRVKDINLRLGDRVVTHLKLIGDDLPVGTTSEWTFDDLSDYKTIRIPCDTEHSNFKAIIETKPRYQNENRPIRKKSNLTPLVCHSEYDIDCPYDLQTIFDVPTPTLSLDSESIDNDTESIPIHTLDHQSHTIQDYDDAMCHFTPGRIYESGGKYYGIYKRLERERPNTNGKVDVAEVDCNGNKISNLEWRHIYTTRTGKEFIYGISNHEWKVYTGNVLPNIGLSEMDRFG